MKDVKFIIYKYTFSDGKVYIGRTRTDQSRYMNSSKYEGQYVGKMMSMMPDYKGEIIFSTENPFIAYRVEAVAIKYY